MREKPKISNKRMKAKEENKAPVGVLVEYAKYRSDLYLL
jgi:hypothetical protein